MCGIAGLMSSVKTMEYKEKVAPQITSALVRRGPDEGGVYIDEKALLIHRRLAVVDIENGKQPMHFCRGNEHYVLVYNGELYMFHAPIDREHIGILHIDRNNLADSRIILQAHMHSSCFYPFIQYGDDGELRMSYTVTRQHIRLAKFVLSKYL